ncbi:AAA family ATPase [Actinoplanes sp. LDG1-06]|uniref:AAA family ATPase n=1 Tax=Paractinoplanes ovalisporus TaxID=2810368 RepID=A0ABS2A583_9ACTN|nr:LuxR family transcriptional regulator [Actinoplanes ovalisporus]MBM2614997.1 AAA family ATPase [Actinoplanes ovalisporus]
MGTPEHRSARLVGRHDELRRIDDLTGQGGAPVPRGGAPVLRGGAPVLRGTADSAPVLPSEAGTALVLRGAAGIGKSALLDHAAGATGVRILRAGGSEFEQELPYAALHQLCLPLLDRDAVPEPLRVAFGLAAGTPDPFRVGLAALDLFTGGDRPVVGLIDDAQWLDAPSALALAFLARRSVTLLFAVRTPHADGPLASLPALEVGGLTVEQARELLAAHHPFPLDERVRDRLIAEAGGNPRALLQLPGAGGFQIAGPLRDVSGPFRDTSGPFRDVSDPSRDTSGPFRDVSGPSRVASVPLRDVSGSFRDVSGLYRDFSGPFRDGVEFEARTADLKPDTALLLTLASADPTGDPGLLWPAAERLGLDTARTSAEAAATGLAEFGAHIRFCHPLARSAAYRAAHPDDRRSAHRALAAVTDPERAPDRRAWHLAQATTGPDDDLAAELERCAERAQTRGGVAAAAAFLDRSAALSLDPTSRFERALAAAQAHIRAGDSSRAAELLSAVDPGPLDVVDPGPLDVERRARLDLVRGQVAFTRPGDGTGPALMIAAARRLSAVDRPRARECLLDAVEMSLAVGRAGGVLDELLAAAREPELAPTAPDALDALVTLAAEGHRAAAGMLREAISGGGGPAWSRRPALATMMAAELWDPAVHTTIAEWLVEAGRGSGSPMLLRLGLAQRATDAILKGDIGRAIAATAEETAIGDVSGQPPLLYHRLHLAAIRGHGDETRQLLELAGGAGGRVTNTLWATALLGNGLADYPSALAAGRTAIEQGDLFLSGVILPELVEAAVRCHEPAVAERALAALTEHTQATATVPGLGVAAYARGLVTGNEDHYREAVDLLARTPMRPYLGRAHLLYGEWLRRAGRRSDSRVQLRTAYEMLAASGAEGFARRAADELRATGERVPRAAGTSYEKLTMQESAVARLVAAGGTSNEVATRLFVSKRTVDAHLRNIFRKLGVTSRRQLKDLM